MSDDSSRWAIRDIKHGKTFSFDSFDEMSDWVNRFTDDLAMDVFSNFSNISKTLE